MPEHIHFSHANGFPAATYHSLLAYFQPQYKVNSINCIGHNPKYPVTNNWVNLPDELIAYCESHYTKPVILMGHSLGAITSFMVAIKRPDLVRALIMLDAPIPTWWQKLALKAGKRFGFIDYMTPASRTKNRRTQWQSKEQAIAYFNQRKLMQKFDKRCLHDYVEFGTKPIENKTEQTIELIFQHHIEMAIYRSLPDNLNQRAKITCPSAIFAGTKSAVFWSANAKLMQKMGMHLDWTEAGHMFPLEQPELTANKVQQFLAKHL